MSNDDLEKVLISVWRQVLNVPDIGLHDHFLDLGGDSIHAVRLLNYLQKESGQILYPTALFRAPTVSQMAEYLKTNYPECVYGLLRKGRDLARSCITKNDSLPSLAPALTEDKIAEMDKSFREKVFPLIDSQTTDKKNKPALFILSPGRSGSTLLRVMLAGNPRLFSPPELNLLFYKNVADLRNKDSQYSFLSSGIERAIMEIFAVDVQEAKDMLDDFAKRNISAKECYAFLQDRLGDRMLVDKSPLYSASLPVLRRAEVLFDRPYYIHLMRHPYAMIRSFMDVKMNLLFDLSFSGRELAEYLWLAGHQNILELLRNVPAKRQYHVKFEDLVRYPRSTMEDLCRFLSISFAESMLEPYEGKKMTDGIYEEGPMVGDPKFFSHRTIDPGVGQRSKERLDQPICALTKEIAISLGYSDL